MGEQKEEKEEKKITTCDELWHSANSYENATRRTRSVTSHV